MNKRSLGVGLAVLLTGIAGCDDTDFLTDVGVASTEFSQPRNTNDLEEMITGAYWVVGGSGGFRGTRGNEALFSAYVADLGHLHDELGVVGTWERDWYTRDFTRNDHSWSERWWHAAYAGILQANKVIDWVERNGAFDDKRAGWTDRIVGEAHFIRAWQYFTLQKLYGTPWGAVPGNTGPSVVLRKGPPESAFDNPGLATTAEVYDFLVQEVEKAVQMLPPQFDPARDSEGFRMRADRMAAHFLAARIYFQKGDHQKALQHANTVLNSGRFPLNDDVLETWNKRDWGDVSSETVLAYYTSGPQLFWKPPILTRQIGYADGLGRWSLTCAGGRCNTSQDLSMSNHFMNVTGWADPEVAADDERFRDLYVAFGPGADPRPQYKSLDQRWIWANKWYRSGNNGLENPSIRDREATLPLMRSAELYLTRAWILAEQNQLGPAVEDLNRVRARADVPLYTGPMTQDAVKRAIEVERMIELAFEDDRLYFLQAIQKDIPPSGGRGSFPWQQARVPYPEDELNLNPNIDL